jgi:amino acid adenylation domain-containing protein
MKKEASNMTAIISEATNLIELLRGRALSQPDEVAYTFLSEREGEEEQSLTYGELDRRARAIAALLAENGAKGERALLLYPPGLDYVAAFFGCLYASVVAVPAYPPRLNRNLRRLQSIAADSRATMALTTASLMTRLKPLSEQVSELKALRWLATDGLDSEQGEHGWSEPVVSGDELAFIQYTSGSTAEPRGVMITHANVLSNEQMIQRAFNQSAESVIVGWLPLYHDMGLIGNLLQPLYLGARCILMSPAAFLRRPARWLEVISRYKATTSGGPNFAYDLCARKVSAEERAQLDLSSWSVAYNGAEPVRAETLERFAEVFAECGFRREALAPCYGLAESTLLVSAKRPSSPPTIKTFDAQALADNVAREAIEGDAKRSTLAGCGETLPGQRVLIVNPISLMRAAAGEVGEVWVSGPSVAQGYWNTEIESEQTFRAYLSDTGEGPFLRTGDMGFLADGELFITGRIKDLIIIRGLNHFPQDIELTVQQCDPALEQGRGAAFTVEIMGQEQLVVVQEADPRRRENLSQLLEKIRRAVTEEHELEVHAVVLIKAGTLPRTSSGKVQRRACRELFLTNSLTTLAEDHQPIEAAAAPISIAPLRDAADIETWLQAQLAAKLGAAESAIDINQPITRYGIDSLSAIELTYRLEQSLGVKVEMVSFLEGASIAKLAEHVRASLNATPSADDAQPQTEPVAAQNLNGEHPLSYGQKSLWFMHRLSPESTAYNIPCAMRIEGELDVTLLREVFQSLTDRHAALRTVFDISQQGEPVQRVSPNASVRFEEQDATTWDEATLHQHLSEAANRPFNLSTDSLLRVSLYRISAQEHVMLLVMHHIITDFWSLSILMQELSALYQAKRAGRPLSLEPLPLQYTDYVDRQRSLLEGAEGERLWSYWERQLAGQLPVFDLPAGRTRPPTQTFRGASVSFQLDPELAAGLKALAREKDATLYTILLTAFVTLLHRYSGQEEILVSSPTTGRSGSELSGLVGYFVNPVVVRANITGSQTFKDMLEHVRERVLATLAHQQYPFALLVERLGLERDPSRSPLAQVMFALQRTPDGGEGALAAWALNEAGASMEMGDLRLESISVERQSAQFDLTLMMAEEKGRLLGSLKYNTDLFDESLISEMAAHFCTLLRGVVKEANRPIATLPLLGDEEQEQILREWNETQADYARDKTFSQLFEEQAARTPLALAVEYGTEQLTYAQLNSRANQLASYLQSEGLRPEERVGICLSHSLEMVVALLGVLKAGGVYVPLDPAYPSERLALIIRDAEIRLLLSRSDLFELPAGFDARLILLDREREAIDSRSDENPPQQTLPGNLAYVIYTSGSTGKPKGVMVEHRSIINLWTALERAVYSSYGGAALRVGLNAPLIFDASVKQIAALLGGHSLHPIPEEKRGDGNALLSYVEQHKLDALDATPSHVELLLGAGLLRNSEPSLKLLLVGGEAINNRLWQTMAEAQPGIGFFNVYGPTECTVDTTACEIRKATPLSIGRPLANVRTYVLDQKLQLLPAGVPGELHVAGAGLARGYLNRPALTAEKFIPNPFSDSPGERLYKTGDLVCYESNGEIRFLERIDRQVKLRGFRIELGEIEEALREHQSLSDAAVLLVSDEVGEKCLVAYVVSNQQANDVTGELRSYLKGKLPAYMIPQFFVTLEALPRTTSGKVDRMALPPPERVKLLQPEDSSSEPRTPVEELLSVIFAQMLGLDEVGLYDNFFELGGHSLLATRLISQLQDIFPTDVPLLTLFFEDPTVAGLAAALSENQSSEEISEKIEQVLSSIGELSDDEVNSLLSQSTELHGA